ncbi:MAG: hypothetical protein A4S12_08225 [Proteobacteria bacterium SG_bin5]|nr:hypothetical protein [Sphingomonas sp.]OQW41555.1 MAG: hypothetical protein A4S12_08225 [Proteobacteria bacterium SG_bin5]
MKFLLAAAALASMGVAFKNKTIDLPQDPPGLSEKFEAVTQNCTGCHSSEFLTAQPKLSRAAWAAEVAKMRKVYHAPIEPGDDAALVDALVALQGG